MRATIVVLCLLCLPACLKTAPREMTEDEKWQAALAAGPADPISLKEFVVMPLAATPVAADKVPEQPEVAFYAPLPEGWKRVNAESVRASDETFVSGDGNAHVDFKMLSGEPERLADGLAKEYENLGYEVELVSVSLDGSVAEFTYANRSGFDLACSNQPPVSGRVVIRHPAGWPPQLLLEAEGRWPYNPAGTTYADVWDVMDGVVTQ